MVVRRTLSVLAPLCAVAVLSTLALAQPAPGTAPTPGATPTPVPGLVGAGTITISTMALNPPAPKASGATPAASPAPPMTLGASVAFEVRQLKFRIDLLSVTLPDMSSSPMGAPPKFPPGGFTLVADPVASKFVLWVPSTKKYYSGNLPKPSLAPKPKPSAAASAPAQPFDPFTVFRSLKGIKTFSFALTGHVTTDGHPSSQYDFALEREYGAGNSFAVHGQMQLADDMDELPLLFQVSVNGNKIPQSSFRYNLTSLERTLPPESDFHPPGGYKLVKNPGDAFK